MNNLFDLVTKLYGVHNTPPHARTAFIVSANGEEFRVVEGPYDTVQVEHIDDCMTAPTVEHARQYMERYRPAPSVHAVARLLGTTPTTDGVLLYGKAEVRATPTGFRVTLDGADAPYTFSDAPRNVVDFLESWA